MAEEDRFKLVREEYERDVVEMANYWINKGWTPLGGVVVEPDIKFDGRMFYLQTLWKPDASTAL